MVGRTRQLEVLTGVWERVVAERRPHLVTVFGPAGIGKSRLSLEFMEFVGSQEVRLLRGRSTPYGSSSPYGAFAQHMKQIAQAYDSDELPEARAKLDAAVAEIVGAEAAAEHAAHLALLIGLGEDGDVPDRETLFFSARVLVESLGDGRADAAPVRGHPLGRLQLARPARDPRRARSRRAGALPRARQTGALERASWLGRRASRLHGTPTRSADGR